MTMPTSLHELLVAEAERDGLSVNRFAVPAPASAVRREWDQPPV